MNRTQNENVLEVTTPGDREIVMRRRLDAPCKRVFAAFTEPDLLRRWLLGPDGWSMPICEVDLTPGGAFHYVWRNDQDGKPFGLTGTYREVVTPEKLIHAEKFDGMPDEEAAIVTTTFVEHEGSTVTTISALYPSREARDAAIESGMTSGVETSYDRLAGILEQAA